MYGLELFAAVQVKSPSLTDSYTQMGDGCSRDNGSEIRGFQTRLISLILMVLKGGAAGRNDLLIPVVAVLFDSGQFL